MDKRCPRCGEYKDKSEFGKNSHQWDGLQTYCAACRRDIKRDSARHTEYNREYMRQYRKDHPKRLDENIKEERKKARHDQAIIRSAASARERNKREKLERLTAREARVNSDEYKAMQDARKRKRRERDMERRKEYREAHLDEYRISNRQRMKARRARLRTNGGSISRAEWRVICSAFDNKCACCGQPETLYKDLTMDHIVPVSKGGGSDWTNIQPLCFSCNAKKHTGDNDYRSPEIVEQIRTQMRAVAHFGDTRSRVGR